MQTEIQLQAKCFQYAWNYFPETRLCFFHVPNGGSRNAIEGMQLKASGVVAGIPDILFIWQGQIHAFEFKTLTGSISAKQFEVHQAWRKQGVMVNIIRTFEDWQSQFEAILCSTLTTAPC